MSILPNGVVEVQLTRGLVTIIDAEDLELVSQHKWCADRGRNTDYARRQQTIDGKKRSIKLHRVILNAPDGMHVDHINGNGLDNRKANLRLCTHAENRRNGQKRKGCLSEYKGVSKQQGKCRKRWTSTVRVGEKKYTKSFLTEIEAALWYDEIAREHFGEFAKINFP